MMELKSEKRKDGERVSASEAERVRFEAANLFIRRLVVPGLRNNSNSNHI